MLDERRRLATEQGTAARSVRALQEKSDDLTPERVLMGQERLAVLDQVIRAMPKERRRSFLFNRLYGLSCVEIARRTGYSESAVKKHIAIAMDALEAALSKAEQAKNRGGNL